MKRSYEKLYIVPSDEIDNLSSTALDNLVFQGSKNWDFYFDKNIKNKESCLLKNSLLLEFDKKDEFEKYLREKEVIDYSIEHLSQLNKYFILVHNN